MGVYRDEAVRGSIPASMLVASALAASLVTAIAHATGVADCANETNQSAAAFVRSSFDTHDLRLYDGTHVTVAISHSPCLAHNAVNRVLVYARKPDGTYELAFDDYGSPDTVDASSDGTVTLTSHETVEIVDEATYVWNGRTYVFSPERSQRYDVAIGEGRPYVVRVEFARGRSSATLSGTIAGGFGDDYEFDARAGQKVTVRIVDGSSKNVRFDVYRGRPGLESPVELVLGASQTWSGTLPSSGTWNLSVSGVETMAHDAKAPYSLILTIR